MKRDMDLLRKLMLRLEEIPMGLGMTKWISVYEDPLVVEGVEPSVVYRHLEVLCSAGFLEGSGNSANAEISFQGLTWKGHDFVDSVRDEKIWNKAKEGADKVGGITVDLLVELAKGLLRTQLKKHTGVEF